MTARTRLVYIHLVLTLLCGVTGHVSAADPKEIDALVAKLEGATKIAAEHDGITDTTYTLTARNLRINDREIDYVSTVYRVKSNGERQLVVGLVERWFLGVTVYFIIDDARSGGRLDGVYDLSFRSRLGPIDSLKFQHAVENYSMYQYDSRAQPKDVEASSTDESQQLFDMVVKDALTDPRFVDYYADS